ncbi:hypothetical protein KYC_02439, partial [Achromobacter arsenitoxydans SY8]
GSIRIFVCRPMMVFKETDHGTQSEVREAVQ